MFIAPPREQSKFPEESAFPDRPASRLGETLLHPALPELKGVGLRRNPSHMMAAVDTPLDEWAIDVLDNEHKMVIQVKFSYEVETIAKMKVTLRREERKFDAL